MRDKYYLKVNPKAFFRPKLWARFYDALKPKQQPYFKIAIQTGARVNEIRHLRAGDIDFENSALTFYVTKVKATKGESRPVPREIKISTEFKEWLQRFVKSNKMKPSDTFPIQTTQGIDKTIKKTLQRLEVENWKDFSSHNVRKTHGNWLKASGFDGAEICSRLGHDYNTMLKNYVSADIFDDEDRFLIRQILGDLVAKND